MKRVRDALSERESPFRAEYRASVERKARRAQPRDLLRWFLEGFRAELPDAMHTPGVWRDERHRGDRDDYRPVGGSLIGSPRTADPFRSFIEDDAYGCEYAEYDGHRATRPHFARPMRAALARLAGRGRDSEPYPFMARALYRTALRDGDWDGACASLGIIEPVRRVYIDSALYRLWQRYEDEPQPKPYREANAAA